MIQDLGSDHLPILLTILLTVPLSLLFRPTNVTFPSIFRKLVGMTFYFDSHCPSAEEYSSLFLSSAAALFNTPTLNVARSSISFGHIKRIFKAWWSAEVEDAVSERCKTRSSDSIERSSEYWCLPLDPSKYEASFFSVDPYQASLQPNLSLFNSASVSIPLQLFLGSPLTAFFPFLNMYEVHSISFQTFFSLKAKFFPHLKALRCISTF